MISSMNKNLRVPNKAVTLFNENLRTVLAASAQQPQPFASLVACLGDRGISSRVLQVLVFHPALLTVVS